MKEWIEVIRDHRYFNLIVSNTKQVDVDLSFAVPTRMGGISVDYDGVYKVHGTTLEGAPDFIALSEVSSYATPESDPYNPVPHKEQGVPAQKAGNIAFVWGTQSGRSIKPHREDGFPAVVMAISLSKFYRYGILSRYKRYPAIKAEHLCAMWYAHQPGIHHRNNGPTSVTFENYKEFWDEGEYNGQKWSDHHLRWRCRPGAGPDDEDTLGMFLDKLNGKTDLFSDTYFLDPVDEVCYIADFA